MPEGVFDGGERVDAGVDERQGRPEPPPDPVRAPKGWRWDRSAKDWVARQRAAVAGEETSDETERPPRTDSAWATGLDGRERHEGVEVRGDDDDSGYVPLTDEQRVDVEAILELFFQPLLTGLAMRDPYCGGELLEHWDRIREKSLPLIARSPAVVEWMTKAGGAMDWLAFAAALQPVATAVWRHHVSHSVVLDDDGHAQPTLDGDRYPA